MSFALPPEIRLIRRLVQVCGDKDACWPWPLLSDQGYGIFRPVQDRTLQAHRVVYELLVGPIPIGYQLDHLCHTRDLSCAEGRDCPHRACVNPAHMDVVTGPENSSRGHLVNSYKKACPRGHPYDESNTYRSPNGRRHCRICRYLHDRKRRGHAVDLPQPVVSAALGDYLDRHDHDNSNEQKDTT